MAAGDPPCVNRRRRGPAADRAVRVLEAGRRIAADAANPHALDGLRRSALFRTFRHQSADAGLVQPQLSRPIALSPVRRFQLRFAGGAVELSISRRAGDDAAGPIVALVGRVRLIRGSLRGRGHLDVAASPAVCRCWLVQQCRPAGQAEAFNSCGWRAERAASRRRSSAVSSGCRCRRARRWSCWRQRTTSVRMWPSCRFSGLPRWRCTCSRSSFASTIPAGTFAASGRCSP